MKRLRILIVLFTAALTLPLAWFVARTYQGLEREEVAELRFFASTLFDRMENDLAEFVRREEGRDIDEYNVSADSNRVASADGVPMFSPLTLPPEEDYILGYLQNNPDGTFQTPLAVYYEIDPQKRDDLTTELDEANTLLNRRRTLTPEPPPVVKLEETPPPQRQDKSGPAGRYLDVDRFRKQKAHLGRGETRVSQITADQAQNVAQAEGKDLAARLRKEAKEEADDVSMTPAGAGVGSAGESESSMPDAPAPPEETPDLGAPAFKVEVDPMQAVFLDEDRVFIYRRIVIDNQVYRQGAVIRINRFLRHMAGKFFDGQPMAEFAGLSLHVTDRGREAVVYRSGIPVTAPTISLERVFPRPFSFLRARLECERIPRSPGRSTLLVMSAVLGLVMLTGLFAIYRSARVVVELSHRRSGFVSSVTHELKTPLTNIRMYIEMLEQGIAPDPEREQEYFRILGSETSRLSRLINNVLEFSKLETRQRRFDMKEGDFLEVTAEVTDVMREKLRQEEFAFEVKSEEVPRFSYDREVMVQVLINLIENSMKFGQAGPKKAITLSIRTEGGWVSIGVSDTGPGIPPQALKKVFDDFYRVDDSLTRNTRGTGIGLALVKKLVTGMGGRVFARNNTGPGCTITIRLPLPREERGVASRE